MGKQESLSLLDDLGTLISDNLFEGMAVHLEYDRYLNEYKAPPIPQKMKLDSHYGVCFRACMARMISRMRKKGGKDILHVVLERGHKNAMDCERIFNDFKVRFRQQGADLFGSFTLEDKQSCMPLMAADMIAATYSIMRARQSIGDNYTDQYVLEQPRKGSLAFIELAPDSLLHIKEGYEANRQERIADYHARKQARSGLSSSQREGRSA